MDLEETASSYYKLTAILDTFERLEKHEQIWFLQTIHKKYEHMYDYATMSEPLQRFFNSEAKRSKL